jgi:Xaa-Pro aminopeptidase
MPSRTPDSNRLRRQKELLRLLESRRADGLLVSHLPNLFYLTGFSGSAGMAFFSARRRILWVDGRYGTQAREQASGARVIVSRQGTLPAVWKFLNRASYRRVGFESDRLNHGDYLRLRARTRKSVKLVPFEGVVENLRESKDSKEVAVIRRACRLTAEVLGGVRDWLRPGIREREVASEIDYRLRQKGSEGVAFETLVASGPRSALPHGVPSERRIRKNDLVLIDLGAILEHYCADMTRTLFLGKPDSRTRKIYERVLEAQQRAIEAVRPGVRVDQVDRVARKVLKKSGLDKSFTHSLGHGLGLEIHEAPRLARTVKSSLPEGAVITIEPGVYLPGWGGIRIEDTVLVGRDGPEVLTPGYKNDWVIG